MSGWTDSRGRGSGLSAAVGLVSEVVAVLGRQRMSVAERRRYRDRLCVDVWLHAFRGQLEAIGGVANACM
jgi:hypothetical protein